MSGRFPLLCNALGPNGLCMAPATWVSTAMTLCCDAHRNTYYGNIHPASWRPIGTVWDVTVHA